jgi:hypothetical protein
MREAENSVVHAAVGDPVPIPAAALTPYQQVAAEFNAAILQLVTQIPGYSDVSLVKSRRVVTPEFVGMTLDAVDASGELQGVRQLDTADGRDMLQLREALRPVMSNLLSVHRRLDLLLSNREAKAGRSALAIYNIASRLALNPNNTHIAIHVEKLRNELRKKRVARQTPPAAARAAANGNGKEAR